MPKALRVIGAAMILALTAGLATVQSAGETWNSSFQIMNLGSSPATVTIGYYTQTGQLFAQTQKPINPNSAINVYVPNELQGTFLGNVVISSDQEIAAIGSHLVTWPNGEISSVQYSAVDSSQLSQTLYVPTLVKNFGAAGWTSRLDIQNAGTSSAQVTIRFYDNNGNPLQYQHSVNIALNGSAIVDVAQISQIPSGFIGSAVVNSTQMVAGVVDLVSSDNRVEGYNMIPAPASRVFFPTILRSFGANSWTSSFQLMNVGSAPVDVILKYYQSENPNPIRVETITLKPFQAVNRFQGNEGFLSPGWLGSVVAEVVGGSPVLVGIGSQSSYAPGKKGASAYNGVGQGQVSVLYPTILNHFGASDFVTSFQVMNVGSQTANISIQYFDNNGNLVKQLSDSLAPFTTKNRYQPSDGLPSGFQGSVKVTSTNGQPLVGVGSQNALGRQGDTVAQYNAILRP